MIAITNDAARVCYESVRQLSLLGTSKLMRIRKDGSRATIALEPRRSGDRLVTHNGTAVLAVPKRVAKELSNLTLDVSKEGVFVLS